MAQPNEVRLPIENYTTISGRWDEMWTAPRRRGKFMPWRHKVVLAGGLFAFAGIEWVLLWVR